VIGAFDQAPIGIGFAYGEPGGRPVFGYHVNPDYGDNTARLRKHVREWALNLMRSAGITSVWCEQIIVRTQGLDTNVLDRQYAVRGGIETAAEMLRLEDDCYEALIADWRREFYSGARPTRDETWKDLALVECARRGWLTDNHNIAEALGIWHFGCICTDRRYRANAGITKRRAQLNRERAAS
jgi:hypothetical protein